MHMVDRFNKLLASYSVTRILYDSEKGVYDILQKYIIYVILENNKYCFSLTWITDELNNLGSFDLKEAVVKTCLKQLNIHHNGTSYTCNPGQLKFESNWKNILENAEKDNDYLTNSLISYLVNEKGIDESRYKKEQCTRALCDYLLDGCVYKNDSLTKYISEYVIDNKDERVNEIISRLKEGTIIHEGIRYSDNVTELYSSWKGNLTLYLDTEILFGICGYNSGMLQNYCSDFIDYVQEINRNAKKGNQILLRYFEDTYKEISSFFETAVRIVKKLDIQDPTKEAMQQITDGCESTSDVEKKRTLFFDKLSKLKIEKDERDYYDFKNDNNLIYNIEQDEIEEKYSEEWSIEKDDIHRSLVLINNINKIRQDNNCVTFEKCKAIFVTATNRTKRLAYIPEIYVEKSIPFVTYLDFIINRFWLRLHKGFGEGKKLRTLDMVVRARTLLSGIISDKVFCEYQKLRDLYDNGEMTKEQFIFANNDLKDKLKKPEEISTSDYDENIELIEKWDLQEVQEKYEYEKTKLKSAEKELSDLQLKVEEIKINSVKERDDLNKEFQARIHDKEQEINLKNQELENKERRIRELEESERKRTDDENKKKERKKKIFAIILIVFFVGCFVCSTVFYVVGAYLKWENSSVIGTVFASISVIGVVVGAIKKFWNIFMKNEKNDNNISNR